MLEQFAQCWRMASDLDAGELLRSDYHEVADSSNRAAWPEPSQPARSEEMAVVPPRVLASLVIFTLGVFLGAVRA